MLTTTVTAGHTMLIKKTDGTAEHLIILAQGTQSGRDCIVPDGKTIHHYIEENYHFAFGIETFELAIRGKLQPRETYATGQRTTDYRLTLARGNPLCHHGARYPEAQLHRYVEQSDRATGALAPLDASGLGLGVSCDILSMRHRGLSHTITS